jgi:hypothetical protein
MNLVPKEILMSHLQRSEGAEEVSLPIDFFRDLLYQAMPRTWVGLTEEDIKLYDLGNYIYVVRIVEARLKELNTRYQGEEQCLKQSHGQ